MKKLIITFLLSLSLVNLSGCGDSGNTVSKEDAVVLENYKLYASEEFSIRYPKNWSIETKLDGYPETTIILFLNELSDSRFKENINIDKRAIKGGTDGISFAQQMLSKHEADLINFQKIAQQNIQIKIAGEDTDAVLAVFEGKNMKDGDKFKFIQVYAVKNGYGYIATATMLNSANDETISSLTTSLKTLTLL